ncbi:MAG: hypothetical protein D6798_17860 [Deltaproteobacteria bacterium]|nr:MAG: hypothetical protein D6798_17860 [Deltaproteobacteria bacterium]
MLSILLATALSLPGLASSNDPGDAGDTPRVDLNRADAGALASLPEVDEREAAAIVSLREQRGRLPSVEALRILDLDEVTLDALRNGTEIAMPVVKTANPRQYKTVDEVMATFAGEPTVAEVQQMAMTYTTTHPDMVQRWLSASRTTFLLPQLDFKYRKELDLNEDFTYEDAGSSDPTRSVTSGDVDNNDLYEVKLRWQLQKLVMSSERIRVISEAQDVAKLRDKVLEEVTRLYFDRRRHQIDMLLDPPSDLRDQVDAELKLQELTATIDAFTGGRFSAMLPNG